MKKQLLPMIAAVLVLSACTETEEPETLGQKVDKTTEAIEAQTKNLQQQAEQTVEKAKAEAKELADKAGQTVEATKEKAAEVYDKTYEQSKEAVNKTITTSKNKLDELQKKLEE